MTVSSTGYYVGVIIKVINDILAPRAGKEYTPVQFDYFFEPSEKSLSTNQDGEIKYGVNCNTKTKP